MLGNRQVVTLVVLAAFASAALAASSTAAPEAASAPEHPDVLVVAEIQDLAARWDHVRGVPGLERFLRDAFTRIGIDGASLPGSFAEREYFVLCHTGSGIVEFRRAAATERAMVARTLETEWNPKLDRDSLVRGVVRLGVLRAHVKQWGARQSVAPLAILAEVVAADLAGLESVSFTREIESGELLFEARVDLAPVGHRAAVELPAGAQPSKAPGPLADAWSAAREHVVTTCLALARAALGEERGGEAAVLSVARLLVAIEDMELAVERDADGFYASGVVSFVTAR